MINKESSLSALYFNKLKREISFEINRAGIITCIESNVESILGYKADKRMYGEKAKHKNNI